MSDSVRPHRRQPTRLPHPWDSPGKNTGVGCHFLLQCVKVKSESEVAQSCLTLSDPMDCRRPGSSIHGIFQARVLAWGAIAFSAEWSYLTFNLFRSSLSVKQTYKNTCHTRLGKINWVLVWLVNSQYILFFVLFKGSISIDVYFYTCLLDRKRIVYLDSFLYKLTSIFFPPHSTFFLKATCENCVINSERCSSCHRTMIPLVHSFIQSSIIYSAGQQRLYEPHLLWLYAKY